MTTENDSDQSLEALRRWTMVQPMVSAFLRGIIVNKTDCDDLLQEAAVAVIKSYGSYDQTRSFDGWVLGVAQNVLRNHFRKVARDRLIFDEGLLMGLADSFAAVAPEQTRKMDRLEECLDKLSPSARDLCEMRYREELSIAAISNRVGKTSATIAKTLQRIRDQLRICIESPKLSGESS
jgi:RNA polymerase sigma-70 factor (ECF subfamily)